MHGISATMLEALRECQKHGSLVRMPGGFWTYPGCPANKQFGSVNYASVPQWYTGTVTIRALVNRGKLVYSAHRDNFHGLKFPVAVKPA